MNYDWKCAWFMEGSDRDDGSMSRAGQEVRDMDVESTGESPSLKMGDGAAAGGAIGAHGEGSIHADLAHGHAESSSQSASRLRRSRSVSPQPRNTSPLSLEAPTRLSRAVVKKTSRRSPSPAARRSGEITAAESL